MPTKRLSRLRELPGARRGTADKRAPRRPAAGKRGMGATASNASGLARGARIPAAIAGLQRSAGNRAVAHLLRPALRSPAPSSPVRRSAAIRVAPTPTVQRLLNQDEQTPLRTRALGLETRVETAVNRLPDVIRNTHGGEHPLVEPIRTEFERITAAFGTNDRAEIVAALDEIEPRVATLETTIAGHLPTIERIANAWTTFEHEPGFDEKLADLMPDLRKVVRRIYKTTVTELELQTFDRLVERAVSVTSKQMSAIRKGNVQDAMDLVEHYVHLGYVGIGTLNSFYASSYDRAADAFGAAAPLMNLTSSGSFQWLRSWEFHLHAAVDRDNQGTVTGFHIHTGHIKPTSVARDTGTSITVPNQLLAGVVQHSGPKVRRWARGKKARPVLQKQ